MEGEQLGGAGGGEARVHDGEEREEQRWCTIQQQGEDSDEGEE